MYQSYFLSFKDLKSKKFFLRVSNQSNYARVQSILEYLNSVDREGSSNTATSNYVY